MSDRLYLSIWFPSFNEPEMVPRLLSLLKQFPFSTQKSGVGYLAVHSVSWNEPLLFEQTFDYRTDPERALALAQEFLHEDNAYELEVLWDLWTPVQEGDLDQTWELTPQKEKFITSVAKFDDAAYQQNGHIQVNFGLHAQFLSAEFEFTPHLEQPLTATLHNLTNIT